VPTLLARNARVLAVMDDMRAHDVDFLTIGQYLQPTPGHHPIERFVSPEEFGVLEAEALTRRFLLVSASPLTRSSYHADQDFRRLRAARRSKVGTTPGHGTAGAWCEGASRA